MTMLLGELNLSMSCVCENAKAFYMLGTNNLFKNNFVRSVDSFLSY
jgi:hypothetical protein